MKFSMIFQGVDKASRTMSKIMATEKKMAGAMRSNATKAVGANNKVAASMKGVHRAAQTAFNGVTQAARKSVQAVKKLHHASLSLGKTGFGNIKAGGQKVLRGAALGVGVLTAAYGSAALAAGNLVSTASEFEKFKTMLETSEGSAAGAEKAMNWINQFATETPYKLQEVTKAFIAFRATGLDPTKGLMTSTGDAAAAMGMPLQQAVEAVKDAVVGENERLKEMGITAAMKGNQITYTYMMNGQKKIATALKNDPAGIQKTLETIFSERFGGSMKRLSMTWDGMISTLIGTWDTFKNKIMQNGLFDWMKGKLQMVLETVQKMAKNGDLDRWAKYIGDRIKSALITMYEFAISAYGAIMWLKDAALIAADKVGGMKNLGLIIGAIAFAPTLIATASGLFMIAKGVAFLGAALMANPISIAIAGIVAGAYLIYRNWDKIAPYFKALWGKIKSAASTTWAWIKKLFSWTPLGVIVKNWDGISKALAAPFKAGKEMVSQAWESIKSAVSGWVPDFGDWSLPKLDSKAIGKSFSEIKTMLSGWVPDFGTWTLPALDTAALSRSWEKVKSAVSGWVPDFGDWSLPKLDSKAIGKSFSEIKTMLSGWVPDFGTWTLPALDTAALSRSWEKVKSAVSGWVPDFTEWKMPSLNIEAISKTWGKIKKLFEWSPLEALEKTFGGIPGKIGEYLGEAAEMAGTAWNRLKNVFSSEAAVDIAARDPASIERATTAANKLEGALRSAHAVDMSGISNQLSKIIAQASGLLKAVQDAVGRANSYLSDVSFHHHGVRMMDTLAAGMRERAQVVVNQIKATMQAVRNFLPSSPAKVGPLSDIHRLKFGETIAASIKAEPMIKAMRAATAATMIAATPAIAAQSSLPSPVTARSIQALPSMMSTPSAEAGNVGPTVIKYTANINISGDAAKAKDDFARQLESHARKIKRLVDEEQRREGRRRH